MHIPLARPRVSAATPAIHDASTRAVVAGRTLSVVATAFLLFDAVGKLLRVQPVLDGTAQLGYPTDLVFGLGLTLFLCVVVYIIPTTSVFGALLLTGYLGGAVATHVRVGNPLLTHVLFPVYMATILWAGLVLRDPRLRVLLPARRVS
jgi:hypothetical protein